MEVQSQPVHGRKFVALLRIFRRSTSARGPGCDCAFDIASDRTDASHEFREYARIAFVALAALLFWSKIYQPHSQFDVAGLLCAVIGAYPIFKEAAIDLWSRRMTMELSMTIALTAALVIGEVFTALVIVFFVLVAEVLEAKTTRRGRQAIHALTDQLPKMAEVLGPSGPLWKSLREVSAGDLVVIRPGGRIPVDAEVTKGHSFVDQASVTGESLPAEKIVGGKVYAGTMNQSGVLEVRVTKVGRDTAFGKAIEAVELAEKSRAPVQKLADRLAGYLVYFALIAAGITLIATHNVRATISVIIVAGACGVAAGTPLAILGAIGQAAKRGVIVKGGLYLERLSLIDMVVLDKTGTLTLGNTEVVATVPQPGVTEEELLHVGASAERYSEHPLGKAIVRRAAQSGVPIIEPDDFRYLPGNGIHCWVGDLPALVGSQTFITRLGIEVANAESGSCAEVFVAHGSRLLGKFQISDSLRNSAVPVIKKLKKLGIRTLLLTGDSVSIAKAVADELEVDEFMAGLLPAGKQQRVKELRTSGHIVAMVGDGINDAAALAEAHVGVAMGSGTDIARETGNVILIGNDLSKLGETIEIARRCRRIILTNFIGTIAVDLVGIALAMNGLLNPIAAVLIHVCSELLFILNSARMLPMRSKHAV